ncbi:MAG: hypothetical protein AAF942_11265, partial [Pseudomonadota bacterium]
GPVFRGHPEMQFQILASTVAAPLLALRNSGLASATPFMTASACASSRPEFRSARSGAATVDARIWNCISG